MKVSLLYPTIAVLALGTLTEAKISKATDAKKPGYCKQTKDCNTDGVTGYECVALQTTREGLSDMNQCLPTKNNVQVCAGAFPGLCPTYVSWGGKYAKISPVCAYIAPANNAKCAKDAQADSKKGEVVCIPNLKDADDKALDAIYGCVDYDSGKLLFGAKSGGEKLDQSMEYIKGINKACMNPKNTAQLEGMLCSGRGTCVPKSATSIEYMCQCNMGYQGVFCQSIESNECANKAQCRAGVCNLQKNECECPAGTGGAQCNECVAGAGNSTCGGQGTCTDKKCVCTDGYRGEHFTVAPAKKSKSENATNADAAAEGTGSSLSSSLLLFPWPWLLRPL